MRFLAVVLLGLVALTGAARGQSATPPAEKYAAAVAELRTLIGHEVADKKLPALSIALVDDQQVVWAEGFGHQDRGHKTPATADTVYRVGSVSKLFTDVAIMQLVDAGQLDLDAPVTKYLPDFKPAVKPEYKPITLRMLMSHRSGLIREPPVGNYFDPTEPGLAKTVASLNGVDLVYPPGEKVKYSNAAIGVVGYVLEKTQKQKFEDYVRQRVLEPLGMTHSSFGPSPAVKAGLADAVMWTYHGREFRAPTFELGESPAGCMYSTVRDLAKFTSCLFAGGKAGDKPLLKPETLSEMFRLQYGKPDDARRFGIGFALSELDGKPRVGHGGAVYGFATELAALPEQKLAAVVVCSRDVANAVTTRLANDALRLMLAAKNGKPLPKLEKSTPLTPAEAQAIAGRYHSGDRSLTINDYAGQAHLLLGSGGFKVRLAKEGNDLVMDDTLVWGTKINRDGDKLVRGKLTFEKEPLPGLPADAPADWKGLIGEYGWDHNTLYIHERGGKLYALIEWVFFDELTDLGNDVFRFPDGSGGLYPGEKLVFTRDAAGRATKVEAAKIVFARRKIDGEGGETFRTPPIKPLTDLRKQALAARPPEEKGDFRKPEMVDLTTIDPTIKLDIRYATDNNFLSNPFYTSARAFMQRPAADAVGRVHAKLKDKGYGLLIHDAYRPWYVTKMFWDATPAHLHNFVANPAKGSRHNRGCAVDLTLYDLKTGQPIEMVSGYDEMTDRAYPEYPGGTSRQRWHRDLLRRAMEAEDFTVNEDEWWHFDYKDWKKYPIQNLTFESIK
ncbi:serine hydrolase [Fimbriiglobus ruber]|uniref:D-alanyl-D-alanine dipeptidase n=1 Tax=Fimbriiglobus ruber TaxID=1908690 RepID=A0A225D981_9BACT|nr:serine hydrolase [Fimbriiglobus ruber]OWK36214.1 Beta-lactamase [Fimbriiglobus ruber]